MTVAGVAAPHRSGLGPAGGGSWWSARRFVKTPSAAGVFPGSAAHPAGP
ncbi:hypothetical protein ACWV95_20410 [Streptomyces albus]